MSNCDVAIVGAGPYGLSVAAHLKAAGVNFRIFGSPMEFWLEHMPKGMHLKSEGFASSLYDPGSTFPLGAFCREVQLPYADTASPVPLDVFSAYGLEFQKRFVPEVERSKVTRLERSSEGFRLTLENGQPVEARRIVIAVGLTYYAHIPSELSHLPAEFLTHSSKHAVVDSFAGREVAIVGAGSSAIDLAALLHQAGAAVQVIARGAAIRFHDPPGDKGPSFWQKLRAPHTGIGPGWKLYMCANLPLVFRLMPEKFRVNQVRRVLGPAPCWFTKEQVVGKVALNVGKTITGAAVQGDRVHLQLRDESGTMSTTVADHVIAATGYRPDVRRLPFLSSEILNSLRYVGRTPALSSHFESSVPGLYFVGIAAANTFGPLLRFAFGAGFAAPRISRHLASTVSRNLVVGTVGRGAETATERDPAEAVVQ